MDACNCKNCEKYPDSKLFSARTCSINGCVNIFHPMIMDGERHLCDDHIDMQHKVENVILNTPTQSDQEYGGLQVENQKYPPKQCIECGKWWQPSKFTWKYAKKCHDCGKPAPKSGGGAKTKQVPCTECDNMVEVGIFAANVQYCDKCRKEKGLTKKGKRKPKTRKDFNEISPQSKMVDFAHDVKGVKNKMLSVTTGSNGNSTEIYFTTLAQLDAERTILNGVEDRNREDTVKEDIMLYLIPRGFKVAKSILYKRYYNKEYVALIFFRDKLHHITWRFEKAGREDSRLIATKENYDRLSEHIKEDIDLVVVLTGVLKDESPLTDEYIEHIKNTQYDSHVKYDDMT